jgi:hypothetical protein
MTSRAQLSIRRIESPLEGELVRGVENQVVVGWSQEGTGQGRK